MKKTNLNNKRYRRDTIKVLKIVDNSSITGPKYGMVEIPIMAEVTLSPFDGQPAPTNTQKKSALKHTHSKQSNFEQGTQAATKNSKAQPTARETIECPYHFFVTAQKTVDLRKKRHQKNRTLFKKKQRDEKVALQNIMQTMNFIEPLFDCILALNQNQKTK